MRMGHGRMNITDKNTICILGKMTDEGEPLYWEPTFHDPLIAQRAEGVPSNIILEYEWIQSKLIIPFRGRCPPVKPTHTNENHLGTIHSLE